MDSSNKGTIQIPDTLVFAIQMYGSKKNDNLNSRHSLSIIQMVVLIADTFYSLFKWRSE